EADKTYKVAGWASVSEEARTASGNQPVWEVVEAWLRNQSGHVGARRPNTPTLVGVAGNAGMAG
ncbi:MAG TPA: thiosulfohydrolase SoxB, partial [Burkholderiaceae bacterium]